MDRPCPSPLGAREVQADLGVAAAGFRNSLGKEPPGGGHVACRCSVLAPPSGRSIRLLPPPPPIRRPARRQRPGVPAGIQGPHRPLRPAGLCARPDYGAPARDRRRARTHSPRSRFLGVSGDRRSSPLRSGAGRGPRTRRPGLHAGGVLLPQVHASSRPSPRDSSRSSSAATTGECASASRASTPPSARSASLLQVRFLRRVLLPPFLAWASASRRFNRIPRCAAGSASAGIDLYLGRNFFLTGEVKQRLFMKARRLRHGLVTSDASRPRSLAGMGFYFSIVAGRRDYSVDTPCESASGALREPSQA